MKTIWSIVLFFILMFFVIYAKWVHASAAALAAEEEKKVSVDISLYDIEIDALFRGQKISLYGAVDNYPVDIIIRFVGPSRNMVVMEKVKKFGLWMDGENIILKNVPSFFALLSNRDIKLIASRELLNHLNLNVQNFNITSDSDAQNFKHTPSDYREMYLTVGQERRIVQHHFDGVKFLSGNMLFRSNLNLPSYIVAGEYDVNVYIFKYGRLMGQKNLKFNVNKSNVQYIVNTIAKEYAPLYSILALVFIWLCGLILHRFIRKIF